MKKVYLTPDNRLPRLSTAIVVVFLSMISLCGSPAYAQDLEINNPDVGWSRDSDNKWTGNYNFGNVVAGDSRRVSFDLYSAGPSAVWTYVIHLNSDPTDVGASTVAGAFSLDADKPFWSGANVDGHPYGSALALPIEMPTGMHFMVDTIFSPLTPGYFDAYLCIENNDSIDPPGTYPVIHLEGNGITTAVPEPASLLLVGFGVAGLFAYRRRST